mmetsp:Transcript_14613/g.42049  ORF Transcript_14613/g.42049 Transcript_14613/m.42049 type:complete len:611 (-) Transcript_14613:108-1940(-)
MQDHMQRHDSAQNAAEAMQTSGGGTWGNLEHLYGQQATTASPSNTGGMSGGTMSEDEDEDDSRYDIMESDDESDADGGGRSTPQDQRFAGYSGFSSPENDAADDGFSIDGEDDDRDHGHNDDDDDTEAGRLSALSLDVTERMSNRMLEPDRFGGSGGGNGRAPPREAFASHGEESDRSSLMGGGITSRPNDDPNANTSLGSMASSMFGRKRSRRAGAGVLPGMDDDDGEEDDFVYYEGARKKNKITMAKARPTIRAILLTVALLLSTYVALGCNFITINVGFQPENLAVESTFDLGLWSYPPSATGEGGGQCLKYPDSFTKEFVTWDPMWVFARSSSLLVILLGWASLILAWLLAIKRPRLKPTLPYKAALAFMVGLMLLFQCFCFVFLQISLCTGEVWVQTSESSGKALSYRADSCKLSKEGNMAIGSLLLYFVLVVALCRSRLREQIEHNARTAGKRAAQMHYSNMHRRRSSTNYVVDDDDELESLGFGEEEKQVDMALDQALSMLESRRFDSDPSSSIDSEMVGTSRSGATGSVSTLTQSASLQSFGGNSSSNFGGLETLNEEDEEETPSEDTDFEDVPISEDRGLKGASKSWQSDRSRLSAMSGYS